MTDDHGGFGARGVGCAEAFRYIASNASPESASTLGEELERCSS